MLKPQDIMIGDYLLADGKVIQVAAIHQKKVGYHNVPNKLTWVRLDRLECIKITPETLTAFGFEKTEPDSLYFSNAFELHSDKLIKGATSLRLSWWVDDDGEMFYSFYVQYPGGFTDYYTEFYMAKDFISEFQHFFYKSTGGNVIPIVYKPKKL